MRRVHNQPPLPGTASFRNEAYSDNVYRADKKGGSQGVRDSPEQKYPGENFLRNTTVQRGGLHFVGPAWRRWGGFNCKTSPLEIRDEILTEGRVGLIGETAVGVGNSGAAGDPVGQDYSLRFGKGEDRRHTLTKKLQQGGGEEAGCEREKQK